MCDNITKKKTPLRNSNSANKPFRSPLTTVVTPKHHENPRNIIYESPVQKNATPKRVTSQCRLPLKRRRIDNVSSSPEAKENAGKGLSHCNILVAKRRICAKKLELEDLRRTLQYIRKHNKENLQAQISKWRSACKEALLEFHKGVKEKSPENVTMRQVLAMLGIAEETIRFTDEECELN